jgi:outer membrane protein TolC
MRSFIRSFTLSIWLVPPAASWAQEQSHAYNVAAPEAIAAPQAMAVRGLTLSELEQMSLEQNPTLVQAGAQVRMSRGNALQAGLYPNPTVGYVADQIGAEERRASCKGCSSSKSLLRAVSSN